MEVEQQLLDDNIPRSSKGRIARFEREHEGSSPSWGA